ncbi:MAG: class I SAM-dependent methyltransferase [Rhodoferax sp.]|uniref:class I SAM-dependent methyltransferase n=1 Tax=Rhodoferax sp. TaxID=50421 RepID=UPI00180E02AC|nr:class I SAM-dependent methyltransferase [Rhodoferax sp.]NMM13117.1 class I SAM-dependent methyltransferase [Rhodoferax sp.]NMM19395.1 class I SAM-dependent methyltransferase [Rhodoferax sp.]
MVDTSPTPVSHGLGPPSSWIQRWSHLVPTGGAVLDIACGQGRHMKWFAEQGHPVLGVDRSPEAIHAAAKFGEAILADIENGPWPLMNGDQARQFDAVIVSNYLWRPLFPVIAQSVAPGGLLIYETFAKGNETVGKPSRPDFLLHPAELLQVFRNMHIVAFEEGFLENPARFVQRIAAIRNDSRDTAASSPTRYRL